MPRLAGSSSGSTDTPVGGKLAFTRDGRRLISAATDQSIRFWDTSNWTETKVLRGHTDEVLAVAISEPPNLSPARARTGNLNLWKEDAKSATDGYTHLPEDLGDKSGSAAGHSRVLLLPSGKTPELLDLKRDSLSRSLPEIGSSTNVLGWFWHQLSLPLERNQPDRGPRVARAGVHSTQSHRAESARARPGSPTTPRANSWRGPKRHPRRRFIWRASRHPAVESNEGRCPWTCPLRFSEDGNYLAALTQGGTRAGLECRNRADCGF